MGSGVGVLANAADVIPSAAEQFSTIPTSLSAVIGVNSVEPADVLGVANLRERLQRAYSDPEAGVEARTAGTELEGWRGIRSRSYAWQVSSILGDFLQRTRGEVAKLAGQIQQAANRLSAEERLRAAAPTVSANKRRSSILDGLIFEWTVPVSKRCQTDQAQSPAHGRPRSLLSGR